MVKVQATLVASNHQERTAVTRGGGGCFLLRESKDLSQGSDNNDLAMATFLAGVILQSNAHASGFTEKCALASSRPTIWRHCRCSDPGWTAPPIRPDMIFGKDSQPFKHLDRLELGSRIDGVSSCVRLN